MTIEVAAQKRPSSDLPRLPAECVWLARPPVTNPPELIHPPHPPPSPPPGQPSTKPDPVLSIMYWVVALLPAASTLLLSHLPDQITSTIGLTSPSKLVCILRQLLGVRSRYVRACFTTTKPRAANQANRITPQPIAVRTVQGRPSAIVTDEAPPSPPPPATSTHHGLVPRAPSLIAKMASRPPQ